MQLSVFLSTALLLVMLIVMILMLTTSLVNLFVGVPFVPSKWKLVRHIVALAELKKGEKVYDLGCGDGRFLIEAEKQTGVEAIGFEAAPIPYLLAHLNKFIHKANIKILMKNFFHADLSKADVIFCYLGPESMKALAPKFQKECRKGTRIYSHTFSIKGVEPTRTWPKNKEIKAPVIYLYQL